MAIEIITRASWGARPPRRRHLIDTPTPELWLHHTAGSSTGPAGMRAIQAYHMDARGWTDIAYNYVVDPQALTVYEGRGAGVAGGHTAGHNCLAAGHRVLTADLDWVPGGDLKEGDAIWGFDEYPVDGYRRWRPAYVTENIVREEECWAVGLSDGSEIITTWEHPWLNANGQRRPQQWPTTGKFSELLERGRRPPTVLKPFAKTWDRLDTYDAGWLAGMFDGEGSIHRGRVQLSQKPGPIFNQAAAILDDLGYDFAVNYRESAPDKAWDIQILGGRNIGMSLVGSVGASRLARRLWESPPASIRGGPGTGDSHVSVEYVHHVGRREIAALGTTTRTFIGEGFAMHNTISHAICVMGNYDQQGVTNGLFDLLVELVDHGHRKGWWPAQITGGHQDASGASTACPGRHLQATIPAINTRTPGGPMPADTPPADWAAAIADPEYHANLWDLQNVLKAHAGYEGALDRLPGPLTKEAWHRLKNSRDLWRDKHDKLEDLLVAADQRVAELEAGQQDDEGRINDLHEQVEGLQQDLAGCQADLDAAILAEGVNWANVRALLDRLDEEIGHPDD